jgi:hypothetical protein
MYTVYIYIYVCVCVCVVLANLAHFAQMYCGSMYPTRCSILSGNAAVCMQLSVCMQLPVCMLLNMFSCSCVCKALCSVQAKVNILNTYHTLPFNISNHVQSFFIVIVCTQGAVYRSKQEGKAGRGGVALVLGEVYAVWFTL